MKEKDRCAWNSRLLRTSTTEVNVGRPYFASDWILLLTRNARPIIRLTDLERGITIKLNAVELTYMQKTVRRVFPLHHTQGTWISLCEVSRSLAACEGAILVDGTSGIEAQTLANVYLATDALEILPKLSIRLIFLQHPERVRTKYDVIDLMPVKLFLPCCWDRDSRNLRTNCRKVPAPTGDLEAPLQALIFDSVYDAYRGLFKCPYSKRNCKTWW